MKKKIHSILVHCLLLWMIVSCDNEDTPPSTPTVTTGDISDITTTSAKATVEIMSDGNATITASGVVFSSAVSQPTLADEKNSTTTASGTFTSLIENLKSNTVYHVRAYATNSAGTAYGNVVDFTTGNEAPAAINLSITGIVKAGEVITTVYKFSDAENDPEGNTTFKWYIADDGTGVNETTIEGETGSTYTIVDEDQGRYIHFGVTPKATNGTLAGVEVKSTFVGPVGEATTVTFTYAGKEVTYGIINSAETGRRWLDRNLGAANVASSFDDYANYGDLFQWGRLDDGHQLMKHNGPNTVDMALVNTPVGGGAEIAYVDKDVPGHEHFIFADGQAPSDWRVPQNDLLWRNPDRINNPCPVGWHIPTSEEWETEKITGLSDGFSKLKLTRTARQSFLSNDVYNSDMGIYWTTTIGTDNPMRVKRFALGDGSQAITESARAFGLGGRCIKDANN